MVSGQFRYIYDLESVVKGFEAYTETLCKECV